MGDEQEPTDPDDEVIDAELLDDDEMQQLRGGPIGRDQLAERAVDSFMNLVRRGTALAGGVLMFAFFASVIGFVLGLAALDGTGRSVWIVLGGFFAVLAVGCVITAIFRLRTVRRGADVLVGEVRKLIGTDERTEKTVIHAVKITEDGQQESIVDLSRQFSTMQETVDQRGDGYAELSKALRAVTTFPGLMALATLIALVFLGLSVLFLISLAL